MLGKANNNIYKGQPMAEFLTTTGVSHRIEQIINGARKRLVLVSPYLKINERFKQLLEEKDRWKIDIRVIYGKQDLAPSEIEWISKLKSVRTSYCKNLHAKCYYNDESGIVTSMNLYEFSEVNNQEIGIAISIDTDRELFKAMEDEVERLLRSSEEVTLTVQKKVEQDKKQVVQPKSETKKQEGTCIRCGNNIKLDIEHPYCRECYQVWSKFKNPEYVEKHCHNCGKPSETTISRPLCRTCFANRR
jgi:phosphatidylserine/phosphatidylglycerophosphate/cardiolipin synthase-like enzyme